MTHHLDDLRFVARWAIDGTYRAVCLMCHYDGPFHPDEAIAAADLIRHIESDIHRAMVLEWAEGPS